MHNCAGELDGTIGSNLGGMASHLNYGAKNNQNIV
jgi:hypothetical protein